MTRKDYVVIAKAIDKAYSSLSYASVNMPETTRCMQVVSEALAYELKLDNPRFDEVRFIEACGTATIERDCMRCEKTFTTTNKANDEFCHNCK